jgi:hypothetical protein
MGTYRKLTHEEWKQIIREARASQDKKDFLFKNNIGSFIKFIPVPILIGGFASTLYIHRYGIEGLVSLTLSCVIGATLIATMSAAFINTMKKFYEMF